MDSAIRILALLTLSSTKNLFKNGQWYNDKNDIQQAFTLILGSILGKHHKISTQFFTCRGRPIPNSSTDFYSERFNPIFSLNMRYSFEFHGKKARFSAYLEGLNLLNQTHIVDRQWDGLVYLDRRLNGIMPIGGITITF